jgi:hypothetical protein
MKENTNEMVLERMVRLKENPFEDRIIEMDNEASDEGRTHTFNEWTKIQNKAGKLVFSRADIYQAVKEGNKKLIKSLRRDIRERAVVSNPWHVYKGNLLADIVHYAGSKNPVICRDLIVPFWNYALLYDVLGTAEGLVYFQVTNGTRDDAKAIKKAYYELSGCKADETFVCTPDEYSRKDLSKRVSGFYYGDGVFNVYGGDLGSGGRSRGVRITECAGLIRDTTSIIAAKKFHRK